MARPKITPARQTDHLTPQTLIFDVGAHTIKAGFAPPSPSDSSPSPSTSSCHLIPNCIARSQRDRITYIGSDLDSCADFGELAIRRPVEKGFIVNWEGEKAVWERSLGGPESPVRCEPEDTTLVLTEAPGAPTALQRNADEMVFEEFEFAGLWRTVGPVLNAYAPGVGEEGGHGGVKASGMPAEVMMVVDAGHSHTMVTPLYHGRVLQQACKRLEVGGKTLTNYLKGMLGRTMDMHREDWICQEIKEDVCYVVKDSTEFNMSLEKVWKGGQKDKREIDPSIVVDYVMPDYEQLKRGFSRPHDPSKSAKMRRLGIGGASEMVLPIGNERFTVPELLFTPSDIGMQQEGIVGTVLQSLHALPTGLWQPFLANVVVVGGTSRFPGFMERLEGDLRSSIDDGYLVRISRAEDPIKNTWLGGARLAQNEDLLRSLVVTRQEYLENGDLWTRRMFSGRVGR